MSLTRQTQFFKEFHRNFRNKKQPDYYEDYWEQQKLLHSARKINFFLILALAVIVLAVLFVGIAKAEITEEVAVHCILGEARLDYVRGDQEALLAHAEALRNRGTTSGVYGCKERWGRTPAKYAEDVNYCNIKGLFEAARKAWRQSARTNIVKGADHWGSLQIDGKWIAEMERKGFRLTKKTKNTAFYRKG